MWMLLCAAWVARAGDAPVSAWLPAYDAVRAALVTDSEAAARDAASALADAVAADPAFHDAADHVAVARDLAGERAAFAELSRVAVLRAEADPAAPKLLVYHCGMFEGYAWWLQPKAGIANPYMGSAMPECGAQVTLKAAAKAANTP